MQFQLGLARLVRLCLKELRESLRDRRTIVTLVLMPLLVYPLLSLVLNRVLLSGASKQTGSFVTFAIAKDLHESPLPILLEIGYFQLSQRSASSVYLESVVDEQRSQTAAGDALPTSVLPRPQLIYLEENGRQALREGTADLVITRKSPLITNDDDGDLGDSSSGNEESSRPAGSEERRGRMSVRINREALRILLEKIRASNQPQSIDEDAFLDVVGTYEVRYRDRDADSERALQLLERILAQVNLDLVRSMLPGYMPPFRLQATPVAMKSSYADMLATMVPLVLVLMTMAGAVYPAIDLTAGERERGTMEALIVSPTSTGLLLLAKYSAVVTVALLTALANLAAMTITLWVSGIGKLIFGDGLLTAGVIGTVLVLLSLFTMFFAALLLAVTSFAKSFKEAQAYLIPLMLLALTPGILSLLPGIKFTNLLATVPLVNIVLLARQILLGTAEWSTAMVAVICNGIYALTALVVASRLFGSNASMQGSQGSWRDVILRPLNRCRFPSVDQMALTMSAMFPMYFIASSALPSLSPNLSVKLWSSAVVSFVLILGLPIFVSWYRRINLVETFRLKWGAPRDWITWGPAVILLAGSAWMLAHEIFILAQYIGIGTIELEQFERVAQFRDQLARLPLAMILFVFAITPAVCEEGLFRGFVLSALHRYSAAWAIGISAIMFGMMHVLTSNVLALERLLPSTFMGVLLAWLALRTGSIWPGVVLHALHNGFLLSVTRYQEQLKEWQILVEEGQHLPVWWLLGGGLAFIAGLSWLRYGTRQSGAPRYPLAEETTVAEVDSSKFTAH